MSPTATATPVTLVAVVTRPASPANAGRSDSRAMNAANAVNR